MDLSVRARVNVAKGDAAQGAIDACESLAGAASSGAHLYTPDTIECLAVLAVEADSQREVGRLLGAAHAIRDRLELVRLKVFDGEYQALTDKLRKALGDDDFDARGLRAQRCRPTKRSPMHSAAAVSASGRQPGGNP